MSLTVSIKSGDRNAYNRIVPAKSSHIRLDASWTLTCKSDTHDYPTNFWNQFSITPGGINGYMVFYLTNIGGGMADYGFTINVYSAKNV
jgi:hypothetical protein